MLQRNIECISHQWSQEYLCVGLGGSIHSLGKWLALFSLPSQKTPTSNNKNLESYTCQGVLILLSLFLFLPFQFKRRWNACIWLSFNMSDSLFLHSNSSYFSFWPPFPFCSLPFFHFLIPSSSPHPPRYQFSIATSLFFPCPQILFPLSILSFLHLRGF